MLPRAEAVALAKRALAHYDAGTTDSDDDVMRVPVSEYLDAERWQAEMDTILRRVPLLLAVSCELANPGDYKAMEAMGVPVLLVRGADGVVRSMLNVCRHRGAQVCETGCGNARRFSCPYHAWVYDQQGALVGLFGADTFGDLDRSTHGLTALPCEERAGFVWGSLTPGAELNLDDWLGDDLTEQLAGLGLDGWTVYDQRELPSPGWKVAFDGYLEGYHLQALHPETVGRTSIANLMVVDTYGPHQRITFATKDLPTLRDLPEDEWDPASVVGPIYSLFPNVSIAGAWRGLCMISQLFPGPTFDRSRTVQTILVREPARTEDEAAAHETASQLYLLAVRDEDYKTGFGIQRGLPTGANSHFTFGRNEITLQHYHRWVDKMMDAASDA